MRCAVHMTRDIERKLLNMGVPKKYHSLYLKDIMGSFYIKESVGLVDARSESDFDEMLLKLGQVWASCEVEFSSQQPKFYKWFCTYHAKDIKVQ